MGERSEEPDSLPGKVPRLLINTLSLTVFYLQAAEDNQQPGQPLLELSQFEFESMQWWAQRRTKQNKKKNNKNQQRRFGPGSA